MPAWVDTKAEEKAWHRAKEAVSKRRGKPESAFEGRDWALVTKITQDILGRHNATSSAKRERNAHVDAALHPSERGLVEALQAVSASASAAIGKVRAGADVDAEMLAKQFEAAALKIRGLK